MVELLLGVDGGGSKTRALLADAAGQILGQGSAGSSNYQTAGFEAATAALQTAIAAARAAAGFPAAAPLAAACFGLAGVGRPADFALFDGWLRQRQPARALSLVNDSELVLAAGTPDGWGVALICGTGTICYGRAPDGRTARTGGWGYLLGDEGSGYAIAIQVLRVATQTADGRAEANGVLQAVLDYWGLSRPEQLVDYVHRTPRTQAEIAALARPVMALADAGDPYAATILDIAARDLATMITTVCRRLELRKPPVALGGGLIGASEQLRQAVYKYAEVGAMTQVDEPARGALVLARRLLDQTAAERAL